MKDLSYFLGPEVKAFFTDVSVDFNRPEKSVVLTEDQSSYLRFLNMDPRRVAHIHQVHGDGVLTVDAAYVDEGVVADADAVITSDPSLILTIRTADCVPVFLYDKKAGAIGLAHAGWRSAADDIIAKTIEMMRKKFGASAGGMKAALGPSIRSCCYQVGQEFCGIFPEYVIPQNGNWYLDLQGACRMKLLREGVLEENILDVGRCTCCSEDLFSYRRQKEKAGRHLSILRLE
ncbi:MAG TPA: peptidoglycan editing factor PgeF [Candidatus Omnitrophota bacterium]|nr:peptidoglycan editing factor PgeF [Candidatus Omnitrophota bacterium]